MRFLPWLLLVSALLLPWPSLAQTSVVLEKKTVTLKELLGREADIHYPVLKTAMDKALAGRIQEAIGLKAGTGSTLEEWKSEVRESSWLTEIDYEISFNKGSILNVIYTTAGMGAHPSESSKSLVVDLRMGKPLLAADLFKRASLPALAARVNKSLRAAVAATLKEWGSEIEGMEKDEDLKNARFKVENLDNYRIDDRGITFLYEFDFPHVILAAEPSEEYFLSFQELKPFMDEKGLLAPLASRSPGPR
jgi:hypothetical protein